MKQCWICDGRGWVRNGEIEDGMMAGRDTCPTCRGTGEVTDAAVLDEMRRLAELPEATA